MIIYENMLLKKYPNLDHWIMILVSRQSPADDEAEALRHGPWVSWRYHGSATAVVKGVWVKDVESLKLACLYM